MTKRKKEAEVKAPEKKEIKISATFDCIQGTCRRYTVGKLGQEISGALYVKLDAVNPPEEISIKFEKGEDK